MLSLLFVVIPLALALAPPVGWTELEPGRVVLNPSDPSHGEIREIMIPGGAGAPEELLGALGESGLQGLIVSEGAGSEVRVQLDHGRVAFARVVKEKDRATWYVVMASRDASKRLDVGALLTAAAPSAKPPTLPRGEVEVLPAGGDGNLWGTPSTSTVSAPASPAGASRSLWGAAEVEQTWGVIQPLVGLWGGTVRRAGAQENVLVQLDVNGRLRMELTGAAGERVVEGTWAATREKVRFSPHTGAAWECPWALSRGELTVDMENQTVVLARRR